MPPTERRRRPIPEGESTRRIKITVTEAEAAELEHQARERRVSVSELLVGRALTPVSGLSPADVAMAYIELRAAREEMSRARLERRANPADRDALDAYVKEATDEMLDIARGLRR